MKLDYIAIPGLDITGSDRRRFDVELAHRIGINPVDGGHLAGTTGIGGRIMTAIWSVEVEFPQLNRSPEIHAQLTNALPADVHGLLGNQGFLDRFSGICFLPSRRQSSIEV